MGCLDLVPHGSHPPARWSGHTPLAWQITSENRPSHTNTFKALDSASYLLTSHWPKKVKWLNPELEEMDIHIYMAKGLETGRGKEVGHFYNALH